MSGRVLAAVIEAGFLGERAESGGVDGRISAGSGYWGSDRLAQSAADPVNEVTLPAVVGREGRRGW